MNQKNTPQTSHDNINIQIKDTDAIKTTDIEIQGKNNITQRIKDAPKGIINQMSKKLKDENPINKFSLKQFSNEKNKQENLGEEEDKSKDNQKKFRNVCNPVIAVQTLQKKTNDLHQTITSAYSNKKDQINLWIRHKIETSLLTLVSQGKETFKRSLTGDPYMFNFIQSYINDLIDEIWPGFEEVIRFELKVKINQPDIVSPGPRQKCCILKPFYWFRSFYLYTMDPFDKTFFHKIRSLQFWIFFAIKVCPFYNIQAWFFLLFFIFLIDTEDEYQLVDFILDFKSLQFLTVGCFKGLFAYIYYFWCFSTTDFGTNSQQLQVPTCLTEGIGSEQSLTLDMISYCSQCLVVWFAFILLPLSKKKGQVQFRDYENQDIKNNLAQDWKSTCICARQCTFTRGGRLRNFLLYDLVTFILCLLAFVGFIQMNDHMDDNKITSCFYCIRVIYGLLSVPWLIFCVPGFKDILTTAKKTAYDQYGNCLPRIKALVLQREHQRIQEKEDNKQDKQKRMSTLFNEINIDEILNQKQSIDEIELSIDERHSLQTKSKLQDKK